MLHDKYELTQRKAKCLVNSIISTIIISNAFNLLKIMATVIEAYSYHQLIQWYFNKKALKSLS
jgi:hypothetical protein